MNVLHTTDEEGFVLSVGEFVRQVFDVEFIDLFLSSLKYPPGGKGLTVGKLVLGEYLLFATLCYGSCWRSMRLVIHSRFLLPI
jgi:IKI3 family